MDRRLLFVETLNDLHEKLDKPGANPYSILKTSALLRQLLLDNPCLVDQVRQGRKINGRKLDITYRIAIGGRYEQEILADNPVFWAVSDGFYPPASLVAKPVRPVHLPDFLRTRIMLIEGNWYTVKDIIRQLAHVEGGVHVGTPNDDKERVLTEAANKIAIGGLTPAVAAVRAVGKVVYTALEPLKDQIEQELRP